MRQCSIFRFLFLGLALLSCQARADERLDLDPKKPDQQILHLCKLDGTPIRPLINNFALRQKLDRQGTPCVSADGKKVAFDAWPSEGGFNYTDGRIVVANMDGTEARDICEGVIPSFSPSGKQLVVSRPSKVAVPDGALGSSIWIMNSDGSDKKLLLDQGAWAGQWSADGKSLLYCWGVDETGQRAPRNVLRIYDFETQSTREVFSSDESPFESLHFQFSWSKQNRMATVAGKLKDNGKFTVAVLDIDAGIKSLKLLHNHDPNVKVSGWSPEWHPDDQRILVKEKLGDRLIPHELVLNQTVEPTDFRGFTDRLDCKDLIYTADGKSLIIALQLRSNGWHPVP